MMPEPAGALSITVSADRPPRVALSGQADFYTRDQITKAFDLLLSEGQCNIKADCSRLDYIDSSALSALIRCAISASKAGGGVEIVGASERVLRMLTLCGAVTFFTLGVTPALSLAEAPAQPADGFWQVSRFSICAEPRAAAKVRDRLAVIMREMPLTDQDRQDVLVATGEALSNAIKHGCACNPEMKLNVECVACESRLTVDVADPGPGFDCSNLGLSEPDVQASGGLGIYLMCRCMDEVSFSFGDCTRVRMVKYLAAQTPQYA